MNIKRQEGSKIIIEKIILTKYKTNDKINKEWLLFNGFRYNRLLSDKETEVYTYRFPVYKYNKFTVLECELKVILGDDVIHVDVYDYNTHDKYAPFYYCEYGNYDKMLKEINGKIDGVLKKLHVENDNIYK